MTVMLAVAGPCPDEATLKFNIAGVAGFYSQLAGVLAGLAFAALIFLVSARLDAARNTAPADQAQDDETRQHISAALGSAYRMLLSSFLALTLASLRNAVLGGASISSGRAATEEVVLAVAFSLAGGMLFYAITLTLDVTETLSADGVHAKLSVSGYARNVLVVIVAPLITIYTALGITDYADVRYGTEHSLSALEGLGVTMIGIQLVASWIVYPVYCRYSGNTSRTPEQLTRSTVVLGWTFLIIVFISVVGFGFIDAGASEQPCTTLSPVIPGTAFVATSVAMLFLTTQVARFRSVQPSKPDPAIEDIEAAHE